MQKNKFSKLEPSSSEFRSYPSGQFQLFSKLKNNRLNENNRKSKISIDEELYNNAKYDQKSLSQLENQDSWRMSNASSCFGEGPFQVSFTSEQERQLQMLKMQKICYVVQKNLSSGRSIRQIMQQDVLSQLQFQIWQIYVTGKRKTQGDSKQCQDLTSSGFSNKIKDILKRYRTTLPKKYKNIEEPLFCQQYQNGEDYLQKQNRLQQTSQYYEPRQIASPQVKDLVWNKSKKKSNHKFSATQSTIKHLQSPQLIQRKPNQVLSKGREGIKQNKKQVQIVQFTLGHVEDSDDEYYQDQDNFTERQAKQMESNNGIPNRRSYISEQQFDDIEDQKRYNLTFNRKRKLPKGKAIKNRVMGNLSNEQIQYQIVNEMN